MSEETDALADWLRAEAITRPSKWRMWRHYIWQRITGRYVKPTIKPENDIKGKLSDAEYEAGFNDGPNSPVWGIPTSATPIYEPLTGVLIGYRTANGEHMRANPAKIERPY